MAESLKQFLGKEAVPIFGWTQGVPVEEQAMQQLKNIASLPFIHKHVAVMPDVHLGKGATIGSVIPTKGAIVRRRGRRPGVWHDGSTYQHSRRASP